MILFSVFVISHVCIWSINITITIAITVRVVMYTIKLLRWQFASVLLKVWDKTFNLHVCYLFSFFNDYLVFKLY